jgi:outer membrane protein assembly factor BamB
MKTLRLFGMLIVLLTICSVASAQDFSFVHTADVHAPMETSRTTIAEIVSLGEMELEPFGITASRPAFALATGDLTEFGAGDGTWETYLGYWKDAPFPVYHQSGNHDGTWWSIRPLLREMYGSPYYSFDYQGCRFIGLDSAGIQDPRPNVGQEQIEWLKTELAGLDPDTPVFVFSHHSMDSREFVSEYDRQRVRDLFKPYNVVLWMVGHSHTHTHRIIDGFDTVGGGSTYGPVPRITPGYSVVTVRDGRVLVTHKFAGEEKATKRVLEKPLSPAAARPVISIASPGPGRVLRSNDSLSVSVRIRGNTSPVSRAFYQIDEGEEVPLAGSRSIWRGEAAAVGGLVPGSHSLKITFELDDGSTHSRGTWFTVDRLNQMRWRTFLPGAVRGAPALAGDTLFVGAHDCKLYALSTKDGQIKWSYPTGGEISADPLVVGDTVYAASADGKVYALTTSGKLRWAFESEGAIFSSPVHHQGKLYFGCNGYAFYCIDAATGELVWKNTEQRYTVESKPFVTDDAVYYGAWDTFIYAADSRTGQPLWKCVGAGSRDRPAARYYSPADCGPVAAGGRVFCADRHYSLSIVDAATGELLDTRERVSATALSADGRAIYLRRTDGDLTRISTDGTELWSTPASMDILPTAPVEAGGVVYACSAAGLLSALSARDGTLLWQFAVTPQLRVYAVPAPGDGVVYTAGMDGSITAISPP